MENNSENYGKILRSCNKNKNNLSEYKKNNTYQKNFDKYRESSGKTNDIQINKKFTNNISNELLTKAANYCIVILETIYEQEIFL